MMHDDVITKRMKTPSRHFCQLLLSFRHSLTEPLFYYYAQGRKLLFVSKTSKGSEDGTLGYMNKIQLHFIEQSSGCITLLTRISAFHGRGDREDVPNPWKINFSGATIKPLHIWWEEVPFLSALNHLSRSGTELDSLKEDFVVVSQKSVPCTNTVEPNILVTWSGSEWTYVCLGRRKWEGCWIDVFGFYDCLK